MAADTLPLGSRDALLVRLWTLANSPLDASDHGQFLEEIRLFSEACVNPDTGVINSDVLESLLPKNWLDLFNSTLALSEAEHARIEAAKLADKTDNMSIETEGEQAKSPSTNNQGSPHAEVVEDAQEATESKEPDAEENNEMNVDESPDGLSIPQQPPQVAYVLPGKVEDPRSAGSMSLAEMHYNIQAQPISKLLALNHKVLTTDAYNEGIVEGRLAVIFGRIEELKRADKWGLRQRVKFKDPERMPAMWDHLLSEAKFVRAGLQGDRRHKIAICHTISQAVLQHFAEREQKREAVESPELTDSQGADEALALSSSKTDADTSPFKYFSLISPDVPSLVPVFALDSISKELVDSGIPEMLSFSTSPYDDSATNALGVVPISKFLNLPDIGDDWRRILIENLEQDPSNSELSSAPLPQELEAPSRLSFKTRSDSEIRPPPPPSQQYMSSRVGSAWQPADDQKLLQMVREFHNNWSLVAEIMAHSAGTGVGSNAGAAAGVGSNAYTSNVERRTPWQVFERWMQLTNVDPKELKGKHAEAARQWLDMSSKAPQAARKRQMPISVAPDGHLRGHRRLRWASMLEGIRKVKRKRETAPKPSNTGFLLRQRAEQSRPSKMPSPAELSRMKFERDKQIADQYMHQRLVAQAQVRGSGQNQRAVPRAATAANAGSFSNITQAGQNAQRGPHRPTGTRVGPTSSDNTVMPSVADIPAGSPPSIAGLPMPPSVAAAAAARQQQLQQQKQLQLQQQQQQSGHSKTDTSSIPLANSKLVGNPALKRENTPLNTGQIPGTSQLTPQQQARLRAQIQAQAQAQQAQARKQRQSATPQPNPQQPQQPQQAARQRPMVPFTREQIQDLMSKIAQNNPNLTPQEVQQLAVQNLRRYIQVHNAQRQEAQRRAAAMSSEQNSPSNQSIGRHSASPAAASPSATSTPQGGTPQHSQQPPQSLRNPMTGGSNAGSRQSPKTQ